MTCPFSVCYTENVVILGVDPGSERLGWAAVESEPIELLRWGMISNPRGPEKYNTYLNSTIGQITNDFPRVIGFTEPEAIVAETVPAGKLGSRSELVVAAITVCKTIAFQFGIPWYDVAANTAKKKLTGDGRATKATVKRAVFAQYPEMQESNQRWKKEQKKVGVRASGIPQDILDAIGIASVGATVIEERDGIIE